MVRIGAVFVFFFICYTLVFARLGYWQIIASERLKREAALQHFFRFTVPAKRGEIRTSEGFPIVASQRSYLVYAEPQKIKDVSFFEKTVSAKLNIEVSSISGQLRLPDRLWVPLKHKVDPATIDILKEASLSGLGFEEESKRYYPESSMAAHVLGFVGFDEQGEDKGYFGLEGFYDRDLRGKEGSLQIEKDVQGNPILIGSTQRIDPQDGRALTLWIDRAIQKIIEQRLKEGIDKYGAKEGSIVVMDPTTGGVLGIAAYPSYDPALYASYEKEIYINPIIGSSYEPGSTFKAITMASALSEGVVSPSTEVDEAGPLAIGGYTIRTWNDLYHGKITMRDVLRYSSNVGMVYVSDKLGKEKLLDSMRAFGFGEPTGIDLEGETSSTLRKSSDWYAIDVATLSFGQGIAVTPIQMVRAISAIANGGWLMEPRVVQSIQDKNGKTTYVNPKKIRQVISEKASREMTDMMVYAVDQGEAKWAKPKGYRIAGKTGTAQIPVAGHYDEKKTIASFVGFAPADDPRFVILVTLREPTSSQWGSETAAPLFFNVAKDLFLYLGIAPQ